MNVLDTDYDNYALLLFKKNKYIVNWNSWGVILSRRPRLNSE